MGFLMKTTHEDMPRTHPDRLSSDGEGERSRWGETKKETTRLAVSHAPTISKSALPHRLLGCAFACLLRPVRIFFIVFVERKKSVGSVGTAQFGADWKKKSVKVRSSGEDGVSERTTLTE